MSLFKKMLLAPGAALLLMLLVGAFGLHALRQQRSHLVELAEVRMANAGQANDMRSAARAVHSRAYRTLTWSASVSADHAEKESGRVLAELDRATAALERWTGQAVLDDQERQLAGRIATAAAQYRKALATAMDMASIDVASGVAAMQTADERFEALDHEVDELVALEQQGAAAAVGWADSAYWRMVWIGTALLATAFALSTGISLAIARHVTQALGQAVAAARAVADGNLAVRIPKAGADEIGRLLEALRLMRDNLGTIVGRVRANAESVAVAASQIAQGNGDLSARTESQAGLLQQTAASMEELGGAVRANADHARHAADLASGASDVARRGGDAVEQVVGTMREIDGDSRRIADIVGLIDGIAFQTNILALNAAVEAAQAGEHGRSFAVVAAEVRSLAQRSARAAHEIKQLIAASVERVEHGNALAAHAGTTMQDVVGAIQRVNALIAEISAASGEQSQGVGLVGAAVQQMDQATQQNAALVEQSAAAADSLKQQARHLVEAMAVFQLAPASAD